RQPTSSDRQIRLGRCNDGEILSRAGFISRVVVLSRARRTILHRQDRRWHDDGHLRGLARLRAREIHAVALNGQADSPAELNAARLASRARSSNTFSSAASMSLAFSSITRVWKRSLRKLIA